MCSLIKITLHPLEEIHLTFIRTRYKIRRISEFLDKFLFFLCQIFRYPDVDAHQQVPLVVTIYIRDALIAQTKDFPRLCRRASASNGRGPISRSPAADMELARLQSVLDRFPDS